MIPSGTVAKAAANGALLARPRLSKTTCADQRRARAADERGGDVVAEREREREDRSRREPRDREGQDHAAQRREPPAAEIGRRLDVGIGNALECGVDRQHHEREPDVGEHEPHGPVRVGDVQVGQAEPVQRPVERTVGVQDQPPRVHAHEVAHPQRQHRGDEQDEPQARARDAHEEIRVREGQHHARRRHGRRDPERAEDDRRVRRVRNGAEVVEVPGVHDLAGERVGRPEALDEQRHERRHVDEDERRHRRRDLPQRLQSRPAPGEAGNGRRAPRRGEPSVSSAGSTATRCSALDLSPGCRPGPEIHAVLLAVAAIGDRRLPELDRAVVAFRRVRQYCAHDPFASVSMILHAFLLTGVSPK